MHLRSCDSALPGVSKSLCLFIRLQRSKSQHTVRPGTGLVHPGLYGIVRNVSRPGRGSGEAPQNVKFLLEEKGNSQPRHAVGHDRDSRLNFSTAFLHSGSAVCGSRHPEGSGVDGDVPAGDKKPAEREESR